MRPVLLVALLLALVLFVPGCAEAPPDSQRSDGLHSTVPSLTGMSREQAEKALTEAGYELGDVTERNSDAGAEQGSIIAQDPAAGTSLPRGQTVSVTTAR